MYKILGADKREYGPVSAETVRQWIAERRVVSQTLLEAEGSLGWRMVRDFPEFADALAGQAAVSPVPVSQPPPPPISSVPAIHHAAATSGLAIASLILGILGFFSCGITAVLGGVLGFVSLGQIRQSHGRLSGSGLATVGICVSGVVLLFAIVSLLLFLPFGAAVTLPAASKARSRAESVQCSNNLRQIGLAMQAWQNEHGTLPPDLITLSNQLLSANVLVCPGERLRERKRVSRWSDLNMIGSSYNYFAPPRKITERNVRLATNAVLVTCPIHDAVCHADGSVSAK